MSDENSGIGNVTVSNVTDSPINVNNTTNVNTDGGDVVLGSKIVHNITQILNPHNPVFKVVAISSAGVSLLLGLALILSLFGNLDQARQPSGLLAGFWPLPPATPTIIPPMPDSGFNIAVAQFTTSDETVSAQDSRELSDWLFVAIEKTLNQLPPALRVTLRGPAEIGPIEGDTADTRDSQAAQVAAGHKADLLIYGVIVRQADNFYVQPAFYVDPHQSGFNQGREIIGPNRLGQTVPFTLPLNTPDTLAATNEKLLVRTQVLQHLVNGLAYLYYDYNEEAGLEFRQAAEVPGWQAGEGQEVVYLLQGAARMRAYGPAQSPELLIQAEAAYSRAITINSAYARSYLGLGFIALQQATLTHPYDQTHLTKAGAWFEQSLSAADQPALAYVPAKAAFGLGQLHLAGYNEGYSNWSAERATSHFQQVIEAYQAAQSFDLAWYAGPAHIYLGFLAGKTKQDWATMAAEIKTGINILEMMPAAPQDWLALYWTWLAMAEENRGKLTTARDAYQQAIQLAEQIPPSRQRAFTKANLEQWRAELKRLEETP
jgi:hypothetical protein